MTKKIRDIAKVQIGLVLARKKAEQPSPYIYRRLLLKALEEDGHINLDETEPYEAAMPLENALTRRGLIIMKLSSPFNPVLITPETEGCLIPSQMVSIELAAPVLPEYIRLYLSQNFVAERLLANYFWIAQRAITVESLLNLEIRIPSLKNQRFICDYYYNYLRIRRLRERLDKEEQAMMHYIFSTLSKDTGEEA